MLFYQKTSTDSRSSREALNFSLKYIYFLNFGVVKAAVVLHSIKRSKAWELIEIISRYNKGWLKWQLADMAELHYDPEWKVSFG